MLPGEAGPSRVCIGRPAANSGIASPHRPRRGPPRRLAADWLRARRIGYRDGSVCPTLPRLCSLRTVPGLGAVQLFITPCASLSGADQPPFCDRDAALTGAAVPTSRGVGKYYACHFAIVSRPYCQTSEKYGCPAGVTPHSTCTVAVCLHIQVTLRPRQSSVR